MQSRTTRAIALCPTGNQQGGYYFMSGQKEKIITELNVPQTEVLWKDQGSRMH
jgi:hypothetical protein